MTESRQIARVSVFHESDPERAALARRRTQQFAICFALCMMAAALVLPFAHAEEPLNAWPTVLQLTLWALFCAAWMYLGEAAERAGRGLGVETEPLREVRSYDSRWPILIYLFVFIPTGYGYVYVTEANTGYLGFNYVLLFIVAGFSTFVFRMPLVLVTVVLMTAAWSFLSHAMWDVWPRLGDLLSTLAGYLFSAMMFFMLRRERLSRLEAEALTRDLDAANEKLREYSGKVEELSATQERNRIAREIHDTLGHSLTVVNMQLETARALLAKDPSQAASFLDKAQAMTKRGLADIRASVASLRASPLDGKPLTEVLEGLMAATRASGVEARFEARGEARPLPSTVEAALYRSAQEGLTNVRKHAEAKRVTLELDYRQDKQVSLVLRDDGVGCERPAGGFGIIGIQERIQLVGGETEVATAPGKGLALRITVKA